MTYRIQSNTKTLHCASIALINQTFGEQGLRMDKAFSLLLGVDNLKRQIIAIDEAQQVCSIASYIVFEQRWGSQTLKLGFIGAVCTHPDHQGQRLSSQVLDFLQASALEEQVDLLIISGGRSLYTRRGAQALKQFKALSAKPNSEPQNFATFEQLSTTSKELYQLYCSQALTLALSHEHFEQQLQDSCYRIETDSKCPLSIVAAKAEDGYQYAVLLLHRAEKAEILECFGDTDLEIAIHHLSQHLQTEVTGFQRNLDARELNQTLNDTTLLLVPSQRIQQLSAEYFNADFEQVYQAFSNSKSPLQLPLIWPNGVFFQ